MKKCINGQIVEMTDEEIAELQAAQEAAEREYWVRVDYNEAVNSKIRERYTESQEFAVLRQRDEKPDEYSAYFTYCEECKAFVKEMKGKYSE